MKFSYRWLKEYIPSLPKPEKLAEILDMHAFEVESIEKRGGNHVLDIKILNRAADAFGHMGMAHEIAAMLDLKGKTHTRPLEDFMKYKKLHPRHVLREILKSTKGALRELTEFAVAVEDSEACPRYIAYGIDSVSVGKSPLWLRRHLESLGINSINIFVDLANFIMLKVGQPTHIFDADKIEGKNIIVRRAKNGERMTTLDGIDVSLGPSVLVIADSRGPLAIAGIKGGKRAEVTAKTKRIVIESANFHAATVRKAARMLKISTDASLRFSQGLDPNMAEYATGLLVRWIMKYGGGRAEPKGYRDVYSKPQYPHKIALRLEKIEKVLGIQVSQAQLLDVLRRLDFKVGFIASPQNQVVRMAKKLIGRPYLYGASTMYDAPRRFDCSSFIQYIFRQIGVELPRMSYQQHAFGIPISDEELEPGDLVFRSRCSAKEKAQKRAVGHVGLYIGAGRVIDASGTKGKVTERKFAEFKKEAKYQRARRMLARETMLHFVVEVPTMRKDLLIEEDLIEEVGRILGYYRIPKAPMAEPFPVLLPNHERIWQEKIRTVLVSSGFYETDTYNFIGPLERDALGEKTKQYWELENPARPEFSLLRRSFIPLLAKVAARNVARADALRFFEVGSVFLPERYLNDPCEAQETRIGGLVWHASGKEKGQAFYEAKGALASVFESMGISDFMFAAIDAGVQQCFHPYRSAVVRFGEEEVGFVGALHSQAQRAFGIKRGEAVVFEISLQKLTARAESEIEYQEPSKYPSVMRDISILVPEDVRVQEAEDVIENGGGALLWETDLFDLYEPTGISGKSFDYVHDRRSMAFHLVFQSNERTLRDEEVDTIVKKIIAALESKGWEVRK